MLYLFICSHIWLCTSNTDLLIGGLEAYIHSTNEFIPTNPYYRDDITWCVSAPKAIPKWMNFFMIIIDYKIPIAYIIIFYFTTFLVYCFTRNSRRRLDAYESNLLIFSILLNMSHPYRPTRVITQFLYVGGVLSSLILMVTMQGHYTTLTMIPIYWKQAQTNSDLLLKDFRLSGEQSTLELVKGRGMVRFSRFR